MNYLLLKAQLLADTKTEFVAFPESRVECVLLQIIVQLLFLNNTDGLASSTAQ